jgi:hypothetical protein
MDSLLTDCFIDIIEVSAFFIAMIITICWIIPYFIIVIAFLFVFYSLLFVLFKYPISNLKRLDLISKGPIFSNFS